jgi:putative SOS response-associated peptidase YedK
MRGERWIDSSHARAMIAGMCNNYKMRKSAAEVARMFQADLPITSFNVAEDIYPGYPGMVVREESGARRVQSMVWGFPRRLPTMKPTSKPLKVNNARDDKLLTSFWKDSFTRRRCIIPVTAWAEAEGEKGKMTKTWYSLPETELFAVAGIWRPTDEWGDAYSMVMVDGCEQMSDVHDRMPVILRPDLCDLWMGGTADEALTLARACDDALIVERTPELWSKPRKAQM